MNYLLKTVETYRVASEDAAKTLIEEAKKNKNFTLVKYLSEMRETKQKGEVIDSWYRVTLTKAFTDEKEPDSTVSVEYKTSYGIFPSPVNEEEE